MTEALEAELARLRTELAGVRDVLAQRDRALVAAHRVIEIAQADNAGLLILLDDAITLCHIPEQNQDEDWYRRFQEIIIDYHKLHPGAALLAELDAARAVVAAVQRCQDSGDCARWFEKELAAYAKVREG